MPTYEYECRKCGRIFEHSQKMAEEPLKRCLLNGCNGRVRRLVSTGTGVIFKGSGFYETDYKRPGGNGRDTGRKDEPCPAAEGKSRPKGESCTAGAAKDKADRVGKTDRVGKADGVGEGGGEE